MKQKLCLLLIATSVVFASCLKEDDLDRLRHDMVIEAELRPDLGLPLGKAEITIADLLGMFKKTNANIMVDESGLVTLYYDTVISTKIVFDSKKGDKGSFTKGAYTKYREQMEGRLNIDIFDNLSHMPGGDSLMVNRVYAYMLSEIVATANAFTDQLIQNHGVKMYFKDMRLYAKCEDGVNVEIPVNGVDSIPIRNLGHQSGNDDKYLMMDSTDIAYLINRRPSEIRYTMDLNIDVPTAELTSNPSMEQFIHDSLGLNQMIVNAHFNMYVPCILYVNGLEFTTNIEFPAASELQKLVLDSSYIMIEIENKLPFEFGLQCAMLDEDSVKLGYLFESSQVGSAPIAQADLTSYAVNGSTHSTLRIPLSYNKMELLKKSKTLQMKSVLQTAPSTSGKPMVGIKSEDAMALRLYGIFKPLFHVEIPLGGDDGGNDGDKKGGAR